MKTRTTTFLFFVLIYFGVSKAFSQNNKAEKTVTKAKADTTIYTILPIMPEFGNSADDLQKFIVKKSKYPMQMEKSEKTKTVFAQVVIEKNGKARFVKIVRGSKAEFNAEAKRIIEKMPKWKGGKSKNGEPARIYMLLPFYFE